MNIKPCSEHKCHGLPQAVAFNIKPCSPNPQTVLQNPCAKPVCPYFYKNPSFPILHILHQIHISHPPLSSFSSPSPSFSVFLSFVFFFFFFSILIFNFWQQWARPSNQSRHHPANPLHLPNECAYQHHPHHLVPLESGILLFHQVCLIPYFNFKSKILKRHALCYFLSLSILLIILC